MATAHRKIRRKDLKEKDEFVTTVEWIENFFLTHLTHLSDHAQLAASLPVGVEPAYDGLRINLT